MRVFLVSSVFVFAFAQSSLAALSHLTEERSPECPAEVEAASVALYEKAQRFMTVRLLDPDDFGAMAEVAKDFADVCKLELPKVVGATCSQSNRTGIIKDVRSLEKACTGASEFHQKYGVTVDQKGNCGMAYAFSWESIFTARENLQEAISSRDSQSVKQRATEFKNACVRFFPRYSGVRCFLKEAATEINSEIFDKPCSSAGDILKEVEKLFPTE